MFHRLASNLNIVYFIILFYYLDIKLYDATRAKIAGKGLKPGL